MKHEISQDELRGLVETVSCMNIGAGANQPRREDAIKAREALAAAVGRKKAVELVSKKLDEIYEPLVGFGR